MEFRGRTMSKFAKSVLMVGCAVLTVTSYAATLTGIVKDAAGDAMHGVMVRVTDDANGVSESVYTDEKGVYTLVTRMEGTLKMRARHPYYRDAHATVELAGTVTATENFAMD